jgi:hypothetical protein
MLWLRRVLTGDGRQASFNKERDIPHTSEQRESGVMDEKKLERSLNSIGKACFVNYYELFRDKSRTDPLFVGDFLMRNEKYKEAGATIRVSHARGIFIARRENDALKICAQSERIPQESADKASRLLR